MQCRYLGGVMGTGIVIITERQIVSMINISPSVSILLLFLVRSFCVGYHRGRTKEDLVIRQVPRHCQLAIPELMRAI